MGKGAGDGARCLQVVRASVEFGSMSAESGALSRPRGEASFDSVNTVGRIGRGRVWTLRCRNLNRDLRGLIDINRMETSGTR